jgi:hypothetical protein
MFRGFLLAIGALRAVFLSQADLVLENLALRQQLAAFARNGRRPRIVATDRLFWIALRRLWLRWSNVLIFVKPETVVRWHQAGFRRYWSWLSQRWLTFLRNHRGAIAAMDFSPYPRPPSASSMCGSRSITLGDAFFISMSPSIP